SAVCESLASTCAPRSTPYTHANCVCHGRVLILRRHKCSLSCPLPLTGAEPDVSSPPDARRPPPYPRRRLRAAGTRAATGPQRARRRHLGGRDGPCCYTRLSRRGQIREHPP